MLAPCILPLLPVIVGGSLTDGKVHVQKALTIVIALCISVIAFTLILKVSTAFITIPEYVWKIVSGGIVTLLGLITLFPTLWETKLLARLSTKSNILLGKGDQKKSFWGDIIVGAALGPVFSTCSPTYFIVLATVLPVKPLLGLIYLLSYTLGLGISLLVVTFVGQKVVAKLNVVADSRGIFKRVLGVLFILVGIAIFTGFDKKLQVGILESGFFDVTKIEQRLLQRNDQQSKSSSTLNNDMWLAPEISSPDGFINTDGEPITLAELRGTVVLLDIWTYSCINCQRTIPYLNDWYAKYHDQGFEIVGLHTPEFGFEKVQSNVEKAVEKLGIQYPVVLDNDYSTWRALGNNYWPRKYLIDSDGYIIYDHIGEGAYGETEMAIQNALRKQAERTPAINTPVVYELPQPLAALVPDMNQIETPEIYFGAIGNQYLSNGITHTVGIQEFMMSKLIFFNKLYLGGVWNIQHEYAENSGLANIVIKYGAKNVYIVASSQEGVDIEIYQDGAFVKNLRIQDEGLYTLIEGKDYGRHTLILKIPESGLRAFTFTFG